MKDWPPMEFQEDESIFISGYFDGKFDLPSNWYFPLRDLQRKVFQIFQQLLDKESFGMFVEKLSQDLSQPMWHNILTALDNGEISACFANAVSLFVNCELSVESNEETYLYLPLQKMSEIIERAGHFVAPSISEPVLVENPSYLYQTAALIEEKENSQSSGVNVKQTVTSEKNANKRKPSTHVVEPETPNDERVKRIRPSLPLHETEEQRRSKEFTAFLEALL
mmetsp:Transcript_12971/g.16836  ORF Transcript_12971/g.16836 Transcript_12971/m.16836 type:complete len:223 (-) Transcript_12971:48-716(-)